MDFWNRGIICSKLQKNKQINISVLFFRILSRILESRNNSQKIKQNNILVSSSRIFMWIFWNRGIICSNLQKNKQINISVLFFRILSRILELRNNSRFIAKNREKVSGIIFL